MLTMYKGHKIKSVASTHTVKGMKFNSILEAMEYIDTLVPITAKR